MRSFGVLVFYVLMVIGCNGQNLTSTTEGNVEANATTVGTSVKTTVQQDVIEKWLKFNKDAGDLVEKLIRRALPLLTEVNSEVDIEPKCTTAMLKVVFALRNLKSWAVRMLDASGRPPPGLLVGTISDLGNYDECLAVEAKDEFSGEVSMRGQYCALNLKMLLVPKPYHVTIRSNVIDLSNFTESDAAILDLTSFAQYFYRVYVRLGLCIPDSCSTEDLQKMANAVIKNTIFSAEVAYCQKQENGVQIETLQIVIISLLTFMVLLMVLGTILESALPSEKRVFKTKDFWLRLSRCFSVRRNFNLLTKMSGSYGKLDALDGIRVLSMGWIVLVHSYAFVHHNGVSKLVSLQTFLGHWTFSVIINAWVSVDSFFLLGGILVSYTVLQCLDSQNRTFSFIRFSLRRIFRLAPCVLLTAGVLFLLPLMDKGPNWTETVGDEIEKCRQLWWGSLFFLNSWMKFESMCLIHTWYVSADIQLYLLSPIPIYLLYRWPKIGMFACLLLILSSIGVIGALTYVYDLYPTIMYLTPDVELMHKVGDSIYFRPYSHLGPYVVGIIVGFFILKNKTVNIKRGNNCLAWLMSLFLLSVVIYGPFPWHDGYLPARVVSSVYASLHRTAWAVGLGWITFACATGHGGPINTFLSWPIFRPLSRLTYLIYLMHLLGIWQRNASRRERFYIRHYDLVYEVFGNIVASVCVAFVCHLLVEAPFAALDKIIFPSRKVPPKTKQQEIQEPSHFVTMTKFTQQNNGEPVAR